LHLVLNVHLHLLGLDGVYVRDKATGRIVFHALGTRTRAEVASVAVRTESNVPLVETWPDRFGIRRLDFRKARIEDVIAELDALPVISTLVTFVHAHVAVDDVLSRLRWDAAFTLACCHVRRQLSRSDRVRASGTDMRVPSPARDYQS
jgi:hypothetical protein